MELQLRGQQGRQNITKKIIYKLQKISARKIIYAALIFFVSLVKLPFGTLPLGVAVFAALFSLCSPLFVGTIVLLAGFASDFSAFELIKAALSILIFSAANAKFSFKSLISKSVALALSTLFCLLIPKLFGVLYLYDTVIIFAESLIFFLLTMAFSKAAEEIPIGFKSFEGTVSAAVVALVAIIGTSSISYETINLGIIVAATTLLIFSHENGTAAASVAGISMGVALGISLGNTPYFVMLFATASLISGIFSPFGKAASALAYVLSASFATLYWPYSLQGFVNLTIFSFSAVIFMLLPKKITSPFSVFKTASGKITAHFKEYISNELLESALAISDISKAFKTLSQNGQNSAASSFFERATNRICSECSLKNHCWRSEFHRTYSAFFVLMELCDKNGYISYCDIPGELVNKCVKPSSIPEVFNFMHDIYKVDKLWEGRLSENREMVACQLSSISSLLMKKAETAMEKAYFLPRATASLSQMLKKQNINFEKIYIFSRKKKNVIADITFSDKPDTQKITLLCQNALKGNYYPIYQNENFVRFALFPPHKILTAIACKPKRQSAKNGDTALYSHLPNQQYLMLISDGMGCGEVAALHSKNTALLAEKLLQCGASADDTANIINSALVLKSTEVSFASLDMAIIDFKTSCVKFYKMGAAPSFIKNGETVKTVYATTLPAGSFPKSDISVINHNLSKGDMIIMVSDGVANGENTEELEKIISGFSGGAKEMSNMLLSYSGEAGDDITIMTTCIN